MSVVVGVFMYFLIVGGLITTNSDGIIYTKFGYDAQNSNPYLYVKTT